MRRVTLGRTGLEVSEVGFGGIPIIPLGMEEAAEVVRHCFDLGITLFDTANMYRDSEKKIGLALDGIRDQVVIATKTLARDAEKASAHIRYSLENLRTTYIDIYQLHNVSSPETLKEVLSPGGAYEALRRAREQGKVRFIGISSHNIKTAEQACRTGLFDTLQFPFNFIERDPADHLFDVAMEMDMGIIAMKPLGGGVLEEARLCFGFLRQYPHAVPIPGIRAKEEAQQIVSLYQDPKPLTQGDCERMEALSKEIGRRFCHRCEYCLPCEQGIPIPTVLGYRSIVRRFPRDAAIAMLKDAMDRAELCTQCGQCIERCPYELDIPALLRENLEMFRGQLCGT